MSVDDTTSGLPRRAQPQKWALLVGIDHYGIGNLSGAVRDAMEMGMILLTTINVPASNIRTILGHTPGGDTSKVSQPTSPSRKDIIGAMESLAKDVPHGDFVYIHFSGHGTQVPTVYEKQGSKLDEALLCADGSIIRDIELGILLDKLAENNRTVLTVLDCCHSGGALRTGDEMNTRYRETVVIPEVTKWLEPKSLKEQMKSATSTMDQHWFYKDRSFNLIAACQPDERAKEMPDADYNFRGILTYSLRESLAALGSDVLTTNYRTLMEILQVRCRVESGGFQSPLGFGPVDRIIFGFDDGLARATDFSTTAIVERVDGSEISLNRGRADGVRWADQYLITSVKNDLDGLEVSVEDIDDFSCRTKPITPTDEIDAKEFWYAKRCGRITPVRVTVIPLAEAHQAIKNLKRDWRDCIDDANPLEFRFDGNSEGADFLLSINGDSKIEVSLGNGKALENTPTLAADGRIETTKRLCAMLRHLHLYMNVDKLQPPNKLDTKHELQILEEEPGDNPNILAKLTMKFNNRSQNTVWITILNLTPEYSVNTIVPSGLEPGLQVRPNESIEPIHGRIEVPKSLRGKKAGSELHDKFKMIISLRPHNFFHYQLPSIYDFSPPQYRNFTPSALPTWDISEKTVTRKIRKSS
ncbi:hypothetical protein BFW01_g3723 [Lasiodiplodia theobromae]|nr:hypothetical protein BFW01_g3723 [Lasiodiplodia theobromae]